MSYTLSEPVTSEDHISGDLNAPVVLVEYGDYQCPYCGQAYPIIKQIQKEFGDNLCFVFRNFPLWQMHPHAFHAAEAAELAADQGKFWQMHDMLYENQDKLGDLSLVKYATQLGMNPVTFGQDLEDDTKKLRVLRDIKSGTESGVNGTPSFFINGVKYDGSYDLIPLSAAIKAAM